MHKKIFILAIALFTAHNLECAQQPKSSHYQLQYYKLHTARPADRFVEPILSCVISPSSMKIEHGELYYMMGTNQKLVMAVASTVSFSLEQYEYIKHHLESKQPFYIEAHSANKGFWQLFAINPQRTKIKKIGA